MELLEQIFKHRLGIIALEWAKIFYGYGKKQKNKMT